MLSLMIPHLVLALVAAASANMRSRSSTGSSGIMLALETAAVQMRGTGEVTGMGANAMRSESSVIHTSLNV